MGQLERQRGALLVVLGAGANRRDQEGRPLRLAVGLGRGARRIEGNLARLLVAAGREQRHRVTGGGAGRPTLRGPGEQHHSLLDATRAQKGLHPDARVSPAAFGPGRKRASNQNRQSGRGRGQRHGGEQLFQGLRLEPAPEIGRQGAAGLGVAWRRGRHLAGRRGSDVEAGPPLLGSP